MGSPALERAVFFTAGTDRRLAGGFTQIPNTVLRATAISAGAKVLYGLLVSYAWQTTVAWPNQTTLAVDAGCSVRNVRRWLQELELSQLICVYQRGLNRPNLYEILPIPESFIEDTPDTTDLSYPDRTNVSHPDRTDLSGPDGTMLSALDRTPVSAEEYSGEEDSKDNNRAREGQVTAPPVVVSSASPPEPDTAHTDAGEGGRVAAEASQATRPEEETLGALLEAAPDLPPKDAAGLLRRHGIDAARLRLQWLRAEQTARAATGSPAIASPAAWLRRSFDWVSPPASFRRLQAQEDRARLRVEIAAAAERRRAYETQERAESAERRLVVERWFLSLPEPRRQEIDEQIRVDIVAQTPSLQAASVPPLPGVLTHRGLGAALWRDRLAAACAEDVAGSEATCSQPP